MKFLIDAKYLYQKGGFNGNGGYKSRIIFCEKWEVESGVIEEFESFKASIILRKTDPDDSKIKEDIELPDHPRLQILQDSLNILHGSDIRRAHNRRITNLSARVVFNEDTTKGGRIYYKTIQGMKREERYKLTFDGEETCEPDFDSMHIQLLYRRTEFGGFPPGMVDAYEFEGSDIYPRKLLKVALLSCINASSLTSAVKAIAEQYNRKHLYGEFKGSAFYKDIWARLNSGEFTEEQVREVIDTEYRKQVKDREIDYFTIKKVCLALQAHHFSIKEYFFTGEGLSLMKEDSDIAFSILEFLNSKNVPCISIHDSFVVKKSDLVHLRSAVENACNLKMSFDEFDLISA